MKRAGAFFLFSLLLAARLRLIMLELAMGSKIECIAGFFFEKTVFKF